MVKEDLLSYIEDKPNSLAAGELTEFAFIKISYGYNHNHNQLFERVEKLWTAAVLCRVFSN
jgi:hypothetical protein